jgi:hypothetical protein
MLTAISDGIKQPGQLRPQLAHRHCRGHHTSVLFRVRKSLRRHAVGYT